MTRNRTAWLMGVAASLLVIAAVARAQRDRPDKDRPLARSIEDGRPRDRPQPRRPGSRRPAPKRPELPPKVVVFPLRHIPAQSIMEVIEQFARAEPAREIIKQVPFAVNEPANALVVVGPPEVVEFFEQLVAGLDKPSEFHERMRDREMAERHRDLELKAEMKRREMELKTEMIRREMELKTEMMRREMELKAEMHARMGGPRPPQLGPGRPEGPGRPGRHGGPGEPARAPFARLLSPDVIRELRLDDDQVHAIRKVAEHVREKGGRMREEAMRAIRELPPERRRREAPEIIEKIRREVGRMSGEVRRRVFEILRPEQRAGVAKMLGAARGERPPREEHRERPREERRERPREEGRERPREERREHPREEHRERPREERRDRPREEQRDRPREEGRERPREERREPPREERRERPPRERPEPGHPEMLKRALGDPIGEFLEHLLSRPVAERLRLEDRQYEKIKNMAKEYHRHLDELREHVAREIREIPPEKRGEKAEMFLRDVRRKIEGGAREVREHIFQVLRPEQREMLERHARRPHDDEPRPEERRGGERERPRNERDR